MGQLSPRPPLPNTATPAEMGADLARYRREISRAVTGRTIVLAIGISAVLLLVCAIVQVYS